jgi:hypothetical protein
MPVTVGQCSAVQCVCGVCVGRVKSFQFTVPLLTAPPTVHIRHACIQHTHTPSASDRRASLPFPSPLCVLPFVCRVRAFPDLAASCARDSRPYCAGCCRLLSFPFRRQCFVHARQSRRGEERRGRGEPGRGPCPTGALSALRCAACVRPRRVRCLRLRPASLSAPLSAVGGRGGGYSPRAKTSPAQGPAAHTVRHVRSF